MPGKTLHKTLLSVFVAAIMLPMVLALLNIKDPFKLQGAFKPIPRPEFSFAGYFGEEFQPLYESYWNSAFGLRGFFVRLHNQLHFSLFNESNVSGVEVGKNNYLYETSYINAYYGYDFIGEPAISNKAMKLKSVSDSLSAHGCKVIVVFAAGKASFYPEYISGYHVPSGNPTNHETYIKYLNQNHIDFIDFNSWFISNKLTSPYVLYPKTGIHWSYYGMTLMADSLIRYIENKLGRDLPDMVIDSIEVKDNYEDTDADIEEAQNLFFAIHKPKMAYPRFHFVAENKYRPRVMVISDSFYWSFYNSGITKNVFSNNRFLYYYNEVYPEHFNKNTFKDDIDIQDELKNTDLVIILTNEPNLNHLGWGFIEETYTMYNDPSTFLKKKNIAEIKSKMRSSPEWMEALRKKAEESGLKLEDVMNNDAEWMMDNQ
jgi:hypothetical protein